MNELALIASDIKHEHTLAVSNARTAIEHAHKAGELLTQAKKSVEHGYWGIWIKRNCPFSERTAQKYMRLSKTSLRADLGINEALEALADSRPTLPNPAKDFKKPSWFPEGDCVAIACEKTARGNNEFMVTESMTHKGYYYVVKVEVFKVNYDDELPDCSAEFTRKPFHESSFDVLQALFKMKENLDWKLFETKDRDILGWIGVKAVCEAA